MLGPGCLVRIQDRPLPIAADSAVCAVALTSPRRAILHVAMPEENVEASEPVKRFLAAFNKRDWGAFNAELDPEVEYAPVEVHGTLRGLEAFAEYLERWLEDWETFSAEVEEVESTPAHDGALMAVRLGGIGKGSGVEIYDRFFWVTELRRGRIYRINEYTDRAEALEAAGLTE